MNPNSSTKSDTQFPKKIIMFYKEQAEVHAMEIQYIHIISKKVQK